MAKLMDIKGYWNMSYGYDFNDRDMWEGQIYYKMMDGLKE